MPSMARMGRFFGRELEGASDYVLAVEGSIWATSSVYEIEVGDYTESSIWRFNRSTASWVSDGLFQREAGLLASIAVK